MKNSSRAVGLGLVAAGLLFVGINIFTLTYQAYYLPKLLSVGIVCGFFGLGFSIFPGGAVDITNSQHYFREKWKSSSVLDRTMWVLFTLAGIAVAILTFVYFDLELA